MDSSFVFNPNHEIRDNILGIKCDWRKEEDGNGGIIDFDWLDNYSLQKLIEAQFIDPDASHNYAPKVSVFYHFLSNYPDAKAIGYAVSPTREDYRISLVGLGVKPGERTSQLVTDFQMFAQNADDIYIGEYLYCWWD